MVIPVIPGLWVYDVISCCAVGTFRSFSFNAIGSLVVSCHQTGLTHNRPHEDFIFRFWDCVSICLNCHHGWNFHDSGGEKKRSRGQKSCSRFGSSGKVCCTADGERNKREFRDVQSSMDNSSMAKLEPPVPSTQGGHRARTTKSWCRLEVAKLTKETEGGRVISRLYQRTKVAKGCTVHRGHEPAIAGYHPARFQISVKCSDEPPAELVFLVYCRHAEGWRAWEGVWQHSDAVDLYRQLFGCFPSELFWADEVLAAVFLPRRPPGRHCFDMLWYVLLDMSGLFGVVRMAALNSKGLWAENVEADPESKAYGRYRSLAANCGRVEGRGIAYTTFVRFFLLQETLWHDGWSSLWWLILHSRTWVWPLVSVFK